MKRSNLAWLAGIYIVTICAFSSAAAEQMQLPANSADNLIGELRYTRAQAGDTLLDIARSFDLGHDQIILANPGINRWLPPPNARILLPSRYLLPSGPRESIVVNLAELRLYYYPPDKGSVHTFPISIGDMDWRTPLGTTRITSKDRNPSWTPPESIRREHELEGEELPRSIPGGDPNNPLGEFALRLGVRGYLIHGTDERRAFGIGMRVSHGCIRMYPEDVETLFGLVPVGTTVRIINEPIKAGWQGEILFLEIHRPLESEEQDPQEEPTVEAVIDILGRLLKESDQIDTYSVKQAFLIGDGIPMPVASRRTADSVDFNGAPGPAPIEPKLLP